MTHALIGGSVMIAIIILLRALFLKRLPKQCFRILWLIAALRLLIPFSFTVEVEVTPTRVEERQTVIITASDKSDGYIVNAVESDTRPSFDAAGLVRVIIPLGTLLSGGFLIFAYIRMRRVAMYALPCERSERWNGADVRAGEGARSPFSCGVIHPVIFIPEHMLALGDERLELIVAHELRHIKSGDQLLKWLLAAAVCLNWYNPLVWLMWLLANRDIELACDEAVVRLGFKNADYALCLIEAEEVRATATVCSFGAPALNERIECIMKSKKLTVCGFLCAALIIATMSIFFVQITAREADNTDALDSESADTKAADTAAADTAAADTEGETVDYEIIDDEVKYEVSDDEIAAWDEQIVDLSSEGVKFTAPVIDYSHISAGYGNINPLRADDFHSGIDIVAEIGTPIGAAASGTVIAAGYESEWGNYVVIDHTDGIQSAYHHCAELLCAEGDEVESGDTIATVGSTGYATGPHLHFEIKNGGEYISPAELFE